MGTSFSEKFHVIWKDPAWPDHEELLRYHEVMGVKSPDEEAERISMNRVPFMGSGVDPLLNAVPFIETSSLIPRRLELEPWPSSEIKRSGARVTFIWKSTPRGLTCGGVDSKSKPSSLHPENHNLASIGPNGSFSSRVTGNWKKPLLDTLVEMLTAPSTMVVYSRNTMNAEEPVSSSSNSLGSVRT